MLRERWTYRHQTAPSSLAASVDERVGPNGGLQRIDVFYRSAEGDEQASPSSARSVKRSRSSALKLPGANSRSTEAMNVLLPSFGPTRSDLGLALPGTPCTPGYRLVWSVKTSYRERRSRLAG